MGAKMTAIAIDKPYKRDYLGDNKGKLRNINLKNGTVLKDLESHNTEIKFLIHSIELNLIATCYTIKELKTPDRNVRALCLINRFSRFGIGLFNSVVIEHFHFDSNLETDSSNFTDEVSCLD